MNTTYKFYSDGCCQMHMDIIKKLFVNLCKRGCIIVTRANAYEYATENLPKCLTLIHEIYSRYDDFVVKSIISNDKSISFERILYRPVCINSEVNYYCKLGLFSFNFDTRNIQQLYWITQYINNDDNDLYLMENKYKTILKNKMIENLTELYLIKFMYLTSEISLPEIKIVIVEILFKLDKWDGLEIC